MSKINIRTVKTLLTESYTITNNEIRLNEAADLTEDITIPNFTRVYTTPNAGQFQVLTFEEDGVQYGGKIIFNSADEGKSVDVTYYGWGSIIWAEDFNNHETRITQNETTITNHESRITTLEYDLQTSSYSTPTEETAQVIHLSSNTVKGQISGSVKGNTATNIVKNGNFADGATGWTGQYATLSASNNILSVTGDGSAQYIRVFQKLPIKQGKIFMRVKARVTNDSAIQLNFRLRGGSNVYGTTYGLLYVDDPIQNKWYVLYDIVEANDQEALNIVCRHNYLDAATANGKVMEVQEVFALDLTALGLEDKTADEINEMFPHWFDGTKSTLNTRLRSVGKNLIPPFTGWNLHANATIIEPYQLSHTWVSGNEDSTINIKVKANQDYTISFTSTGGKIYLRELDENDNILVYVNSGNIITSSYTWTTGANTKKIQILYRVNTSGTFTLSNPQLEQGTVATAYEPYKESVVYLPETLRGLPNGVADEIDIDEGKLKKNTWEKVLENADFNDLYTGLANVDVVRIYKPTDSSFYNKSTTNTLGQLILEGYTEGNITISNWDDTSNIGKFSVKTGGAVIDLFVAKGTYADLASAQADLAGTTLIYQLAEPVTKDLDITPLQCFENGTLYVEQTVRDSGIYSGGLSVSNTNLPIDTLEAVYKVDGDTKTPVDLTDCTVAVDGLSFTITGAVDGEKYEFIYNYPSELGTIPTTEYSVPLNRAAQIDDNTKMINQLSEELGDLWTTLLPLADKELAMFAVAQITTDMSADANDNELKNKINEILAVWQ